MFNEPGRLGIQKHAISCPIASLELYMLTNSIMYFAKSSGTQAASNSRL